ncbi:TIGR03943 family protein [Synechocystis sp. LKSZ1]|uniref:TIGR03943 family putative permease subunit n=1 Tax=Synechocystis sp. LKSZ1 TaxID=3144951 RepID=UPI00336BD65D
MTASSFFHRIPRALWFSGLDGLGILAWGILLLTYSFRGELQLLIHPNYFGLVTITGLILVLLGGSRLALSLKRGLRRSPGTEANDSVTHLTLLPLGVGSGLLLLTALLGLAIPPTVFTSQMALQRGISNTLPATQLEAASFVSQVKPEERSLVDWIRTLNSYPEPDAYQGQKAKVQGFVVYSPDLPNNYLLISRFILTCCAVDAYPVGLPVKLPGDRQQYPQDSWLEIEGTMATETLPLHHQTGETTQEKKRQLVLVADAVKPIPTPADPYSY